MVKNQWYLHTSEITVGSGSSLQAFRLGAFGKLSHLISGIGLCKDWKGLLFGHLGRQI